MGFLKKLFCWIAGIFFLLSVISMGLGLWLKSKLPVGKKIAILKVEGVITNADDILERLKRVEEDKSVKALVVRVNSPGGAVGASQEIYEELRKIRYMYKKPVVVSMGNVAASGGYYISLPANVIFAEGGTITGSIGVIIQKWDVEGLAKKLGIKMEVVKTGKFKDILNPFRPMTPEEREYLLKLEESVLNQFKTAVVENRGKKLKVDIDKIADGRIFSGQQAKELGLIDKIGNFRDAISEAQKLAGIKGKPVVMELKRPQPFLKKILGNEFSSFKLLNTDAPYMVYYLMY
jgi:protease-4